MNEKDLNDVLKLFKMMEGFDSTYLFSHLSEGKFLDFQQVVMENLKKKGKVFEDAKKKTFIKVCELKTDQYQNTLFTLEEATIILNSMDEHYNSLKEKGICCDQAPRFRDLDYRSSHIKREGDKYFKIYLDLISFLLKFLPKYIPSQFKHTRKNKSYQYDRWDFEKLGNECLKDSSKNFVKMLKFFDEKVDSTKRRQFFSFLKKFSQFEQRVYDFLSYSLDEQLSCYVDTSRGEKLVNKKAAYKGKKGGVGAYIWAFLPISSSWTEINLSQKRPCENQQNDKSNGAVLEERISVLIRYNHHQSCFSKNNFFTEQLIRRLLFDVLFEKARLFMQAFTYITILEEKSKFIRSTYQDLKLKVFDWITTAEEKNFYTHNKEFLFEKSQWLSYKERLDVFLKKVADEIVMFYLNNLGSFLNLKEKIESGEIRSFLLRYNFGLIIRINEKQKALDNDKDEKKEELQELKEQNELSELSELRELKEFLKSGWNWNKFRTQEEKDPLDIVVKINNLSPHELKKQRVDKFTPSNLREEIRLEFVKMIKKGIENISYDNDDDFLSDMEYFEDSLLIDKFNENRNRLVLDILIGKKDNEQEQKKAFFDLLKGKINEKQECRTISGMQTFLETKSVNAMSKMSVLELEELLLSFQKIENQKIEKLTV